MIENKQMNNAEKALARILFQNMLAKSMGDEFEGIFTKIMSYSSADFYPVKPQGPQGDWKNDGHEPNAGRYYQVYAPESFDEAKAIKKIEDDFSGLIKKWGDGKVYPVGIKEFYFVINDAYRIKPGAYPTTYAKLELLRQKYMLDVCRPFLAKDLEDKLMNLSADQIIAVVGFPPDPADIETIRFDLISEIIGHIIENFAPQSLESNLSNPQFEKKITFNNLKVAAKLLRSADYRSGSIEEYFSANSNFARQDVRDKLHAMYCDIRAAHQYIDDGDATAEDRMFFWILDQITPGNKNLSQRQQKEIQEAAIVILAYFFEACDIFEEPKC